MPRPSASPCGWSTMPPCRPSGATRADACSTSASAPGSARPSGATGVDLSDEGRPQVPRLAERLRGDAVKAIYSSPLGRTVETARILARPHRLTPILRDGLREISHGRWEGLTRREVEERYADEYSAWEEDPFTFAPKDGEAGVAVLARALPVVREIVVSHPEQLVVVV